LSTLIVTVPDKISAPLLEDEDYVMATNEAECIAIAAGQWLAVKERATVIISADGFCNALNIITSYIIPENIEMDIVISTGRQEPPHKVMSDILEPLIKLLPYDKKRISIKLFKKD